MTDTMADTVQGLADSALEDARTLHNVATVGDPGLANLEDDYGIPQDSDWLTLLDAMALEIYGTRETGPYRDGIVSVTLITGTGGPHTEITAYENGDVFTLAQWGSDKARAGDYLPGLFDTLAPLVDGDE